MDKLIFDRQSQNFGSSSRWGIIKRFEQFIYWGFMIFFSFIVL